jgi:hypothetical protein
MRCSSRLSSPEKNGNGGSVSVFLQLEERGRRNGGRLARRGVLKASRPDWWGQGRRTGATAPPRVSVALWPVGHCPLTKLNRDSMAPSVVTDRAISNVINFQTSLFQSKVATSSL